MIGRPKARLVFGDSNSPLGNGFSGSPCGIPSPGMHSPLTHVRSFHVRRISRLTIAGLRFWARSVESRFPYRLADVLRAVLPLPNRSYEKPSRGWRSFHLTTVAAGTLNSSRTQVETGRTWSGYPARTSS